jgi:hypothetical protein
MSKTAARLLALAAVLALGGCIREPFPPPYFASPAPPPLQPYLGPPLVVAAPTVRTRIVKHRRVKRRYHRRVHCRCTPS